jgi:hypothetical protein
VLCFLHTRDRDGGLGREKEEDLLFPAHSLYTYASLTTVSAAAPPTTAQGRWLYTQPYAMASYLSGLVSAIVPGRSAVADFAYVVGDAVAPPADYPRLWTLHEGTRKVGRTCGAVGTSRRPSYGNAGVTVARGRGRPGGQGAGLGVCV